MERRMEAANATPRPEIELHQGAGGLPYVDFEYRGIRFASKGALGLDGLRFQNLAQLIEKEDTMLHPSAEELRNSWETASSVVMVKEGNIVGHARLEDLPSKDQAEIEIHKSNNKIKKVYEIGSVIMVEEEGLRGNGFSSVLLEATMKLKAQEVLDGNAVFISTTKLVRGGTYMFALLSAGKKLGIDFTSSVHTDFNEVSKRTCICSGEFGQGRQFGDHCPARISRRNLGILKQSNEFPVGKDNCVLFISNPNIDRPLAKPLIEGEKVIFSK